MVDEQATLTSIQYYLLPYYFRQKSPNNTDQVEMKLQVEDCGFVVPWHSFRFRASVSFVIPKECAMGVSRSTDSTHNLLEFESQDEMEVAEHPTIKGLPRRRNSMAETLLNEVDAYPWMRVADHVEKLSRLLSLGFGLTRVLAGWVPNCPSYDLKTELPRLLYEEMRHLTRLHSRFGHLPGASSGIEPLPDLHEFLDRFSRADDHHCFLAGYYFEVKSALVVALEEYRRRCDPLYDAPTLYELNGIIPEVRAHIDWANAIATVSAILTVMSARKM
jgi:hypothetical protein